MQPLSKLIEVTVDLPREGSREDYLHAISRALHGALKRDEPSAESLAGLLTLVSEAQQPKPLTRAEIQRNYRERKKRAKSGECHSS